MHSKSEKQRKFIFYKRNKYGSKKKTPKKDKWIWEEGWNHLESHILNFSRFIKKLY